MNHSDALNHWIKQTQKNQKEAPLPKRFYDERKRPSPLRRHHISGTTPQGEQVKAQKMGLTDKPY